MRLFRVLSAVFLFLCAAQSTFADSPAVRATVKIFVSKHTVGDNIRVLMETESPRDYVIEPPSDKTDLSPFELKKVETSPVVRGKNRVRRTFILTVTAFEKGTLKFPAVTVQYRKPDGQTGQTRTEPVSIEIASIGKRPSDKNDIRGIKGPETLVGGWLWTVLALILAGLLAAYLVGSKLLRHWGRRDDESLKPAHVRARLELERLKDRDLISDGRSRDFAAGLANVLRLYLERRFGVEAMEKTTAELTDAMKNKGMDRLVIDQSRAVLERADRIKFAKEEPTRADLSEAEKEILAIIDQTTPEETSGASKKSPKRKK